MGIFWWFNGTTLIHWQRYYIFFIYSGYTVNVKFYEEEYLKIEGFTFQNMKIWKVKPNRLLYIILF